jgi:opacity protein-like surface antigen
MGLKAKFLAVGAALVVGCGAASAADYAPPEAVSASPFDWSGLYFGGHVGYGTPSFSGIFDNSELPDFPEEATYGEDIEAGGFVGGGQVGFNVHNGSLVFGVEADASLAGLSGQTADDGGDDVIEAKIDVLATVRGRLGLATGPVLLYATGGLAYAGGSFTLIDDLGEGDENSGTVSLSTFGGVVGAGVEFAASQKVSLRVEGLYYMFGGEVDTSDLTDDSDDGDFLALDNVFVIRGGINFRL